MSLHGLLLIALVTTQPPVAPPPPLPPGTQEQTTIKFDRKEFRIPVLLHPQFAAEVQRLFLWVSTDEGRTWKRSEEAAPTAETFAFHAPKDGLYWFAVQALKKDGALEPADDKLQIDLKVLINTTKRPDDAKKTPAPPVKEPVNPNDFEIYKRGLNSGDRDMQRLAAQGLAKFADGFDVLADFLRNRPEDEATIWAAPLLSEYRQQPWFEERIRRLRDDLLHRHQAHKAKPGAPSETTIALGEGQPLVVAGSPAVILRGLTLASLNRMLFLKQPQKHAKEMVESLQFILEKKELIKVSRESWFDCLLIVAAQKEKPALLPLVPKLIELLESDVPATRTFALRSLVVISGETHYFSGDATAEERAAVVERYRAFHRNSTMPLTAPQ